MDPFAEKELIENLKLISQTLIGIKEELSEISTAIREAGLEEDEEEGEEGEEGGDDEESEEDSEEGE